MSYDRICAIYFLSQERAAFEQLFPDARITSLVEGRVCKSYECQVNRDLHLLLTLTVPSSVLLISGEDTRHFQSQLSELFRKAMA